jgi:hypothetical protein
MFICDLRRKFLIHIMCNARTSRRRLRLNRIHLTMSKIKSKTTKKKEKSTGIWSVHTTLFHDLQVLFLIRTVSRLDLWEYTELSCQDGAKRLVRATWFQTQEIHSTKIRRHMSLLLKKIFPGILTFNSRKVGYFSQRSWPPSLEVIVLARRIVKLSL